MDWLDLLAVQGTLKSHPVFLPGEFHVQRNLAGPWGHEESDTTD